MKKLLSQNGESITEALAAILVVSFALTMLAGAIVTAGKVNKRVENETMAFESKNSTSVASGQAITITVTGPGLSVSEDVNIDLYTTENGYYYYEKEE